jgi:DNA-binding NarL/FixJ family response regulator
MSRKVYSCCSRIGFSRRIIFIHVVHKTVEGIKLMALRIRVLVVDDFQPFRQAITAILRTELGIVNISEACDGREAVEITQKIEPDLILLDIGLPQQNGLEAARQIRESVPKSRILFVSQESSKDLVREAFNSGASGFVLKTDIGELATAVTRVLRGEKFVSRSLAGEDFLSQLDEC